MNRYLTSYFEVSHLHRLKNNAISHKLIIAIMEMNILDIYLIIRDNRIDTELYLMDEFTSKLDEMFLIHKINRDHELVLTIYDQDIGKKEEIKLCFEGWYTGFTTNIIFSYKNQKLSSIKFLNDPVYGIENILSLYKDKLLNQRK